MRKKRREEEREREGERRRGCVTYLLHSSPMEFQLLVLVLEVVNGTLQFRQLNSKWCISGVHRRKGHRERRRGEEARRRRGREGGREKRSRNGMSEYCSWRPSMTSCFTSSGTS